MMRNSISQSFDMLKLLLQLTDKFTNAHPLWFVYKYIVNMLYPKSKFDLKISATPLQAKLTDLVTQSHHFYQTHHLHLCNIYSLSMAARFCCLIIDKNAAFSTQFSEKD